jgi:hypothetical protein
MIAPAITKTAECRRSRSRWPTRSASTTHSPPDRSPRSPTSIIHRHSWGEASLIGVLDHAILGAALTCQPPGVYPCTRDRLARAPPEPHPASFPLSRHALPRSAPSRLVEEYRYACREFCCSSPYRAQSARRRSHSRRRVAGHRPGATRPGRDNRAQPFEHDLQPPASDRRPLTTLPAPKRTTQ